jgi:hypothetical protein
MIKPDDRLFETVTGGADLGAALGDRCGARSGA